MQRSRFQPSRHDLFELLICIALAALFVLLSSGAAFAQNVGINNPTPHGKSLLDLTSTDKGLLAPRMTAAQRTAMFPAADATAEGMLVYQTDGADGFYYYDGAVWVIVQAGSAGWGLFGNVGTNPTANFLGTSDNQPLVLRTNNVERARLDADGDLGLGVNNPLWRIDALAPQAVGRFTTTGHANGSVLELRNAGANGMLGALNFNDAANAFPGQVGYHPTDGMTIRTGGVERMRILPNGWVGIGMTTPVVPLDITNTMTITRQTSTNSPWGSVLELKNSTAGTNALGAINFNDGANTFPGQMAYHPTDGITFRSGGAERMRIHPGGGVGIGVATPVCALDIATAQAAQRMTSTNAPNGAVIELRNTTAGTNLLGAINFNDPANAYPGQMAYHAGDGFTLRSGGLERLRVQTNGNVGINTAAPHAKSLLDLTSTTKGVLTTRMTAAQRTAMFPAPDATAEGMLVYQSDGSQGFYYYDGAAWAMMQSGSAAGWGVTGNAGTTPATNFIGTTDNQPLVLRTNNVERARLDADGDLGLGVTSPLWRIDAQAVQAVGRFTSTGHANGSVVELRNMNPGAGGMLGAVNFNDAPDATPGQVGYLAAQGMTFRSGGLERMRILTGGNVGIGTTAPTNKLHVTVGSAGYAANAQSALVLEGNGSTYANVISATGATGVLFGSSSNPAHGGVLYNASGYANAMEFRTGGNTTRMSITDQGNVTIGPGSFSNNYRFNVFGSQTGALALLWNMDNTGLSGTTYSTSANMMGGLTGWANSAHSIVPNALLHGTYGADPVVFMSTSTERMRITGNGWVGIGTTTPASTFHVSGTSPSARITANTLGSGAAVFVENIAAGADILGSYGFVDATNTMRGSMNYRMSSGLTLWTEGAQRFIVTPTGNVGVGNSTPTANFQVDGYTKLASDAPAIKMKKLVGTTAAAEGGNTDIPHGVTAAKILSVQVLIEYTPGTWLPTSYSNLPEYSCNFMVMASNIRIINEPGNSGNMLGKPVKLLITYEQ